MTCRRSQVRVLYRPPRVPRPKGLGTFFVVAVQDSNRAALRSRVSNQPSGLLLSPRFPTHRNVYRDDCRFVVDGTGLEQQRRRPPPAAETGSRGWDSVLIFQSPAKGLRKNQQTQPVQAPAVRFRQGSQCVGMSTGMHAVLWWVGLRLPASISCLGRHSCLAGRCPNGSSLFLPQAAVVAAAVQDSNRTKGMGSPDRVTPCLLFEIKTFLSVCPIKFMHPLLRRSVQKSARRRRHICRQHKPRLCLRPRGRAVLPAHSAG